MNKSRIYNDSIILIGPSGAGKSTIAEELVKKTGMQRLCLDRIANHNRQTGFVRKFRNQEEHNLFMIHDAIQKAIEPGVCDFGAGHSIYSDEKIFDKVKEELTPFKNIILLLPSKDINESLDVINSRSTGDTRDNLKFLVSPCNQELAAHIIYTNGKTPAAISDEIINLITNKDLKTSHNL
ncbi:MAG: AAA family ATPase [Bacilli bacterium]